MSNWSLLADHDNRVYYMVGKWPIFGMDFFVGDNPNGDGVLVDLSDKEKVEGALNYMGRDNAYAQAEAIAEFARGRTVVLLNEEDGDYFWVEENYDRIGSVK